MERRWREGGGKCWDTGVREGAWWPQNASAAPDGKRQFCMLILYLFKKSPALCLKIHLRVNEKASSPGYNSTWLWGEHLFYDSVKNYINVTDTSWGATPHHWCILNLWSIKTSRSFQILPTLASCILGWLPLPLRKILDFFPWDLT